MDVIALHGAGYTGAVAPLGTALTEGQLAELWKLADEPYLCFDGDNAGRRAANRAAERALPLLRAGKSLRFLALPAGEDPDSLIRARGADAIRRSLDLAQPLSDVVWSMETEGKPNDTPERRASLQRAIEQRVAEIADPVVRDFYRTEMRSRLGRLRRPEGQPWQPGQRTELPRPRLRPRPGAFCRGLGGPPGRNRHGRFPAGTGAAGGPAGAAGAIARPGRGRGRPAHRQPRAGPPAQRPFGRPVAGFRGDRPGGRGGPHGYGAEGSDTPLEARLIEDHLERSGLGRLAAAARVRAREAFRVDPADADGWVGQWRRMARHLNQLTAEPEELKRAEEALAEDMSEENLRRLEAILDRIRRESIESGTG